MLPRWKSSSPAWALRGRVAPDSIPHAVRPLIARLVSEQASPRPVGASKAVRYLTAPLNAPPLTLVALSLALCGCGSGSVDDTHLRYWGGRLLEHVVVRNVYVGDYYRSAAGQADVEYNDAFTAALVIDPGYMSVWNQYGVGEGSVLPSMFLDSDENRIDREGLKARAATISAGDPGWSSELVYNFVLSPGVVLEMTDERTSKNGLGGLHTSVHLSDGRIALLSAVAYSLGSNGFDLNGRPRDNISVLESHEITEAATDPDIADGSERAQDRYGWLTDDGEELADLTMNDAPYGTPRSEMFEWLPSGFAVQRLWSIQDQASEIRAKSP